jgi:spermidine synthase
VDLDRTILAFAAGELEGQASVAYVEADAIAWAEDAAEAGERFDYACVDLFRADAMPPDVTRRPFLRALKRLVAPRGVAVFNLFADRRTEVRVRRIERTFRVLERRRVGDNVVVWCR